MIYLLTNASIHRAVNCSGTIINDECHIVSRRVQSTSEHFTDHNRLYTFPELLRPKAMFDGKLMRRRPC